MIVAIYLSVLVVVSSAVYQGVRYQNWRHLSRADRFCTPTECDLSEVGEVSVDEVRYGALIPVSYFLADVWLSQHPQRAM